jgi:hypothetical protein
MAPEYLEKLRSDQRRIERMIERNRDVLETSRQKSAKYARTLTSAGAAAQSARDDLRKAGYLR